MTLSKDLNQFHFFFEVVNTRMNEKVEIRGRTPVQMMILERRNNFVSCVTFKWIYFCLLLQHMDSNQRNVLKCGEKVDTSKLF